MEVAHTPLEDHFSLPIGICSASMRTSEEVYLAVSVKEKELPVGEKKELVK